MPARDMIIRLVCVACGCALAGRGASVAFAPAYPAHVPAGLLVLGLGVFGMGK